MLKREGRPHNYTESDIAGGLTFGVSDPDGGWHAWHVSADDPPNNLRKKNNADFIVANDLSKIGNGKHWAMILGEDGVVCECETKKEIAKALEKLLFN